MSGAGVWQVLDTNHQNMCREILFDPSFSGQVLDFIEAQLQSAAVSADDVLCMGITLFVRVVLRSADLPRLDEWTRLLTSANALPLRASACEWLLERVVEPHTRAANGGGGDDGMAIDGQGRAPQGRGAEEGLSVASAGAGNGSTDWLGKRWLEGVLTDCPSEPARKAFCDVLLCAVHTWCASVQGAAAGELAEDGPVGRVVSTTPDWLEKGS